MVIPWFVVGSAKSVVLDPEESRRASRIKKLRTPQAFACRRWGDGYFSIPPGGIGEK